MATTLVTDPICLKLDADGDVVVPLQFVRGADAVRQGIDSRLRLIKGEVFWDVDNGTEWFENDYVTADAAIMGQPFNDEKVRAIVRKRILATPNTLASSLVIVLSYDSSTRTLDIEWEVGTTFGDTVTGTTTLEG